MHGALTCLRAWVSTSCCLCCAADTSRMCLWVGCLDMGMLAWWLIWDRTISSMVGSAVKGKAHMIYHWSPIFDFYFHIATEFSFLNFMLYIFPYIYVKLYNSPPPPLGSVLSIRASKLLKYFKKNKQVYVTLVFHII